MSSSSTRFLVAAIAAALCISAHARFSVAAKSDRRSSVANSSARSGATGKPLSDRKLLKLLRGENSNLIYDRMKDRAAVEDQLCVPKRPKMAPIRKALAEQGITDKQLTEAANRPIEEAPGWHLRNGGRGRYWNLRGKSEQLARKYPELIRFKIFPRSSTSSVASGGTKGRPMFLLQLGTRDRAAQPKKQIFVHAGIHGDEVAVPEYAVRFVEWMAKNRSLPIVERILSSVEFKVIPSVNPDGLKQQTRVSGANYEGFGVDLNRNFAPGIWGGPGSSGTPGDWNYRGPKVLSEPESKTIDAYARRLRLIGKGLKLSLDLHQYGQVKGNVLHPYAYRKEPPDDPRLISFAHRLAKRVGYIAKSGGQYHEDSGDATDHIYRLKIPALTFEIGDDMVPSFPERNQRFEKEVLPLMLEAAKVVAAGKPPLSTATRDKVAVRAR